MTKNLFNEVLNQIAEKDIEACQALMGVVREGKAKKNSQLLPPFSTCKHIYILQKGLIRHFRNDTEGKEYSTWFSFEGDVVVAMESFVTQEPSQEGFEVMEDCEFLLFSFQDINYLREEYHSIETFFRQLLELYYIELERRLYRLQTHSAKQKYKFIMDHRSEVLLRVPQTHIASFLGITKETLSRIRKNI